MRFIVVLGLLTAVAQSPAGQQRAQQPTFKSGVDLVTLDAIVVDKDGHPVRGLKPDDFIVTLQGQVRPVRLLDFREYGQTAINEARPGPEVSHQPQAGVTPSRGGRVVVIVFDDLSFKPGPGASLLTSVERTLSSFDTDDLIGLATTSGLGPLVNPTRDRAAIVTALHDKRLVGRYDDSAAPFEVTEDEALQIRRDFPQETFNKVSDRECGTHDEDRPCPSQLRNAARGLGEMTVRRMNQQLTTYRAIIATLARAPDTPRVIIALSRGIALGLDTSEYADSLEQLSRTAADSKVQFYALSELPDEVDLSSHLRAQDLLAGGRFMNKGAQVVANAAGGEAFLVSGTADRFIKRIESETSGIYRIGVEAPAGSANLHYLTTVVRVRQPGVSVRASRESVLPSASAAPVDPEAELRTRLAEGGTSIGVPISAGAEMRRDPKDATRIEMDVSLAVPASVKGPVDMMYGVVDEAGTMIGAGRKQVAAAGGHDYRLAFPVPVSTGRYRLRAVASDGDGHTGSVERSVSAALGRIGDYSSSDLLTAVTDPDGASKPVAPDDIPQDARSVTVRLELYPKDSSGSGGPQVRFELFPERGGAAIATEDVAASGAGTLFAATTSFPILALAPGSYTIRATVSDSGASVGTVSVVFRKSGP